MKTSVLKSVVMSVVVATLSSSAFAAGPVAVNNYLKTDYAIVSAVLSVDDNYRIAIKDDGGNLIYRSARINSSSLFQRLIDLSTLADGEYSVIVEGAGDSEISKFNVKNSRLVNSAEVAVKSNVSFSLRNNDLLYVTHLNPSKNSAWININDERGNSIYSTSLPNTEVYSALYKVSELPKGTYVVSVSSDDNTQSYEFSK